jgi:hypothetical protein
MTRAKKITNEIKENINTQKILFRILAISSVVLCAVYIYLIGSTTFNVIARKSLENTVTALSGHVNRLEITYLDGVNKTNKDYAKAKGFVDAKDNIFASRDINHVAIR